MEICCRTSCCLYYSDSEAAQLTQSHLRFSPCICFFSPSLRFYVNSSLFSFYWCLFFFFSLWIILYHLFPGLLPPVQETMDANLQKLTQLVNKESNLIEKVLLLFNCLLFFSWDAFGRFSLCRVCSSSAPTSNRLRPQHKYPAFWLHLRCSLCHFKGSQQADVTIQKVLKNHCSSFP